MSRAVRLAALVLGLLAAPLSPAGAAELGVGPWAGAVVLDPHLAEYRWEAGARPAWGLSAVVAGGRGAAGLRGWRASTRQDLGLPGDPRSVRVALTGAEAIGELRLAALGGFRLLASGTLGLVRFSWSPAELEIADGVLGAPLRVRFDPVTELAVGTGVVVRRSLPAGLDLAVGAERGWIALDTAHRRGDSIVEERETFGHWTARVQIARRFLHL